MRSVPSLVLVALLLLAPGLLSAQQKNTWRVATPDELASALPARASIEKEHIETEMRTASGLIDTRGRIIAGVVLITAGYSADGKYSHYLLVQSPIRFGSVRLEPGSYVIGWQHHDDTLTIVFYNAATGVRRGVVNAHRIPTGSRVESFRFFPPSEHATLQIGRFTVPYTLDE